MNPVPTRERRDYTPFFSENDRQYRETNMVIITMSLIILVGAVALWLYILTPTVHAENQMHYQDVHTVAEACAFAKENPGAIVNQKEVKKHCNG